VFAHELYKTICTPSVLAEKDQFLIKLAENEEEIEKALRLRYRVFNLEQGKGLDSATADGIDRDEYDQYCLHLLVMDKKSGSAVGTYRMHFGPVASAAIGFYSAREYTIKGLDEIADRTIEVGRSCVAPEHRSGAVVALLWLGIKEVLIRSKLTHLFGCVSLETTEPAAGWALYRYFIENGKICETVSAKPEKSFELVKPSEDKIEEILKDKHALLRLIPPLFKGYLRLGANICGEPVLDKEFGTIDYLIMLDTNKVPDRYARHFNYEKEEN